MSHWQIKLEEGSGVCQKYMWQPGLVTSVWSGGVVTVLQDWILNLWDLTLTPRNCCLNWVNFLVVLKKQTTPEIPNDEKPPAWISSSSSVIGEWCVKVYYNMVKIVRNFCFYISVVVIVLCYFFIQKWVKKNFWRLFFCLSLTFFKNIFYSKKCKLHSFPKYVKIILFMS